MTTAAQPTPTGPVEPRERPLYSCVRCLHSLTRDEAWTGPQTSGMRGYFCYPHAPAGATKVVT